MHSSLVLLYLVTPVVMLWVAVRDRRGGRVRPLARFYLTALLGLFAGSVGCVAYAWALNARLVFGQVLLTAYLATSLILLMQIFDRILWAVSRTVLRLGGRRRGRWHEFRSFVGLLGRSAVIFCLGLPFVISAIFTYRPHVRTVTDPMTEFGWTFKPVQFPAAVDSLSIAGWWIPTPAQSVAGTVVFCPELDTDKVKSLPLVKRLLPAGYNVLVFDFRGHGLSGGQLCSFGDLERRDVLGAVRWVRQACPREDHKVMGLGIGTGGAALLAAAADPSPEGRGLDAVAVYGTYDRLDAETRSVVNLFVPKPLSWCVNQVGLPIAGVQVGADLKHFSPRDEIGKLWPRPVLILHDFDDQLVPFERGQALFDAAGEPKQNFWTTRFGRTEQQRNDAASQRVRWYFDSAAKLI